MESGLTGPQLTEAKARPKRVPMVHSYCTCAPWVGLCGKELRGKDLGVTTPTECVVCADLEPLPCPRCGAS